MSVAAKAARNLDEQAPTRRYVRGHGGYSTLIKNACLTPISIFTWDKKKMAALASRVGSAYRVSAKLPGSGFSG